MLPALLTGLPTVAIQRCRTGDRLEIRQDLEPRGLDESRQMGQRRLALKKNVQVTKPEKHLEVEREPLSIDRMINQRDSSTSTSEACPIQIQA